MFLHEIKTSYRCADRMFVRGREQMNIYSLREIEVRLIDNKRKKNIDRCSKGSLDRYGSARLASLFATLPPSAVDVQGLTLRLSNLAALFSFVFRGCGTIVIKKSSTVSTSYRREYDKTIPQTRNRVQRSHDRSGPVLSHRLRTVSFRASRATTLIPFSSARRRSAPARTLLATGTSHLEYVDLSSFSRLRLDLLLEVHRELLTLVCGLITRANIIELTELIR